METDPLWATLRRLTLGQRAAYRVLRIRSMQEHYRGTWDVDRLVFHEGLFEILEDALAAIAIADGIATDTWVAACIAVETRMQRKGEAA